MEFLIFAKGPISYDYTWFVTSHSINKNPHPVVKKLFQGIGVGKQHMVVVTGAAGLVGTNLLRALLAHGYPVRALVHRDRRGVAGLGVEVVQADLADPASLRRAFSGAELVFHVAGLISLRMDNWPELEAVNVVGTRHVVDACLSCGVSRLVHFSSIHAIQQQPLDRLLDETRPRVTSAHLPPYDRSKAASEIEVQAGIARGLDAVILNPTAIFGPFDYKPSYFGQAIIALARGRIPGLVEGGFDWVDARDVAEGAIQAGLHGRKGASYLLGGHWQSVRQVAERVASLSGVAAPRLTVPLWLAYLAAPLMALLTRFNGHEPIYTRATLLALRSNRLISHALARRELGYQPRPFEDSLSDTLGWFVENGYLQLRKPHWK